MASITLWKSASAKGGEAPVMCSFQQDLQAPPLTTESDRLFATSVPIFINVRDRLAPLRELLDWLEKAGHTDITLINVASSYPPLLKFLSSCPYRVMNLKRNFGPTALWLIPGCREIIRNKWFVYTDSDVVPTQTCPLDAVAYLYGSLQRLPTYLKAGLGLCLDDIPARYQHKQKVIEWESGLYGREVMPDIFQADVDTTFALYRPCAPRSCPAIRTKGLYEARHTPWYCDSASPDEEEIYYHAHAWPVARHWRLNNENGGRSRIPPVSGGLAALIETDPQKLLATLLKSKSGRIMFAYRLARRFAGKPTRLWRAENCTSPAEAQQAILEIIRSADWQATINLRAWLDLIESECAFRLARSVNWARRLLSKS